jgi:WD40 repeat protein
MAPEQARAEKTLTVAVDVYALGAILYEMVVGRPPFQGATVIDTVLQVMEREPDDPRCGDLGVIALKCLRKEPGRRYESAAALADDLERWLNGEPIAARPASSLERSWLWVRRNPVVAGLAAACLLSLVAGVVVSTMFAFDARREAANALREQQRAQEGEAVARHRLARSHVLSGNRLLEAGDDFGALVWYAEALKLEEGTRQEDLHRLRIGLILMGAPRLASVWRLPPGEAHTDHDGDRVLSVNAASKTMYVRDALDGSLRHTTSYTSIPPALGPRNLLQRPSADLAATICQVWDPAALKPVGPEFELRPPPAITELSADGARLLLHRDGGPILARDVASGKEMAGEGKLHSVRILETSADGRRILAVECPPRGKPDAEGELTPEGHLPRAAVHVLDARTLKPVVPRRMYEQRKRRPLFRLSPDGAQLLVGRDNELERFAVDDGRRIDSFPLAGLDDVEVVPGRAAVVLYGDEGVRVFDLRLPRDDRASWSRAAGGKVSQAIVSGDGARLAAVEGDALSDVRLYDGATGQPRSPVLHLPSMAKVPAFSRDGSRLVLAEYWNVVRAWDLTPPAPAPRSGPYEGAPQLSDDGTRLAFWAKGRLEARDSRTGQQAGPVVPVKERVSIELDHSGRRGLLKGSGRWHVWNVEDGALVELALPPGAWRIINASWNEDGSIATRLTSGKSIADQDYDAATGKPLGEPRPAGDALTARLPDGGRLLLDGKNRLRREGRAGTEAYSRGLPAGARVTGMALSPDGRVAFVTALLPGGADLNILRHDTAAGDAVGEPLPLPKMSLLIGSSADGSRLVVSSTLDNTVLLFDSASGAQLTPPLPGGGKFDAVHLSRDGRLLLAGERLYDAATGDPLSPPGSFPGTNGLFAGDEVLQLEDRPEGTYVRRTPLVRVEGSPDALLARAELLASRRINDRGALVDLTAREVLERWRAAR